MSDCTLSERILEGVQTAGSEDENEWKEKMKVMQERRQLRGR